MFTGSVVKNPDKKDRIFFVDVVHVSHYLRIRQNGFRDGFGLGIKNGIA